MRKVASPTHLTRRRALTIVAAASVLPVASCRRGGREAFEWRGTSLGADARIVMSDTDRRGAEEAIGSCLAEVERLELSFSLFREDAEIVRVNRTGRLQCPSLDLRRLLEICRAVNAESDGLFDPTVQPLWRFYVQWFAGRSEREAPPDRERTGLISQIGLERVNVGPDAVTLSGCAQITLNGIAQGYITDRVAELLRDRGWRNVLIDLGEVRALGRRADRAPFTVRIRETGRVLPLANAALATSTADSLSFSEPLGLAHILHPRTGATPAHWHSVTVQHPSAAIADALSTALFLASGEELARIACRFPGTSVWATQRNGATQLFVG
jgi:thiamine biosynthesis lipoprotein